MVVSTAVACLVAFLSLDRVGKKFSRIAQSEVPLLVATSRLSQESQGIAFLARDFGKIDNRFTLSTKMGEANDKLASLDALTQSLVSLGADSEAVENIHVIGVKLRQHFAKLDEVVSQRIDIEAETHDRLDLLLRLSEDVNKQGGALRGTIRPEAPDWPPAVAWANSAIAIVLKMNSMLGYDSKIRLEKIEIQIDDLWQEAETQYRRMTPELRMRLAPLRMILARNAGTPPNFITKRLQLLDSAQVEGGTVNQAEVLSSQLVIAAADLFFKTQNEVEKQNTEVAAVIEWTSRLQVATVTITLLVALCIVLYINRSVIRRITTLRTAMTDHAQGREGAIETAGNDEIGEMSRALSYFIGAIKEREDKLRVINADLSLAHRKLEKIAVTDRLTGLFNRNKIDEVFSYELAQAERYGKSLAIIMADIDLFKSVNDTHGHQVGDSVLCEFAAIIRELARDTDTPGRWGGEEFLIICSHADLNGAKVLAERIRTAVADHLFTVVGHKTCSFGVSSYRPGDTLETIVKRADDALYEAKQNGRNRAALEHIPG